MIPHDNVINQSLLNFILRLLCALLTYFFFEK